MSIEKEVLELIVSKSKFPLSKDDVPEELMEKIKNEFKKKNRCGYCNGYNYATCRSMVNDHVNQNNCPYIKYGINC